MTEMITSLLIRCRIPILRGLFLLFKTESVDFRGENWTYVDEESNRDLPDNTNN